MFTLYAEIKTRLMKKKAELCTSFVDLRKDLICKSQPHSFIEKNVRRMSKCIVYKNNMKAIYRCKIQSKNTRK